MAMWQKWLTVAVAGGLGSAARFALAGLVQRLTGPAFPWGTLAVNATGCLLFGVVAGALESRVALDQALRPFLLIGFMGAFTTFSTFAFESTAMLADRQWGFLAANVLGQNLLGLALVVVGLALGRLL
jgi:CrcB protein